MSVKPLFFGISTIRNVIVPEAAVFVATQNRIAAIKNGDQGLTQHRRDGEAALLCALSDAVSVMVVCQKRCG